MVPEQYGEPSSLEVDALTPKIMFQSRKADRRGSNNLLRFSDVSVDPDYEFPEMTVEL